MIRHAQRTHRDVHRGPTSRRGAICKLHAILVWGE